MFLKLLLKTLKTFLHLCFELLHWKIGTQIKLCAVYETQTSFHMFDNSGSKTRNSRIYTADKNISQWQTESLHDFGPLVCKFAPQLHVSLKIVLTTMNFRTFRCTCKLEARHHRHNGTLIVLHKACAVRQHTYQIATINGWNDTVRSRVIAAVCVAAF